MELWVRSLATKRPVVVRAKSAELDAAMRPVHPDASRQSRIGPQRLLARGVRCARPRVPEYGPPHPETAIFSQKTAQKIDLNTESPRAGRIAWRHGGAANMPGCKPCGSATRNGDFQPENGPRAGSRRWDITQASLMPCTDGGCHRLKCRAIFVCGHMLA